MDKIPIFTVDFLKSNIDYLENIDIYKLSNFHPRNYLISEVVNWQRSKSRSAFARALSKGQVSGSGKKPFAQKGRGMARQGSLKNPHQRGGGVAFPPTKRSYYYKINKKKRKIALQSIFFIRLRENRIKIIDKFTLDKPSSKTICSLLKNLNFNKVLFVDIKNIFLKLSVRNIDNAKFIRFEGINTLDLISFPYILMTKRAFHNVILFLFP
jgi:large subunit ribosomal protein L4